MSDALKIDDGIEIEEIDDAEDSDVVSDGNRPITKRTYFINCQTVYSDSFNAQGVKVKDSGNHLPQVTCMSCSLLLLILIAHKIIHVWPIRSWWHGCRPSK